jgi:hypothetical protein
MARPRKKIDQEQLERCAEKHWTILEIAAHFRVGKKTIERRYGSLIAECRERGKSKLRDLQWRRALEGSDRVLLHMSKHYLEQHEKQINEVSGPNGKPLDLSGPQVTVMLPPKDEK